MMIYPMPSGVPCKSNVSCLTYLELVGKLFCVPHLNDRDECIFEAAKVRDLWSALQKFVERVEIVLPCDVLGSDAKCVNVCPLMRDPEKIRPESDDSPTNFLVVLPLHSHAQAEALSPLLNKDIEFFDDFTTQFHALICLVSPVLQN